MNFVLKYEESSPGSRFRAINADSFNASSALFLPSTPEAEVQESFQFCYNADNISCNLLMFNVFDKSRSITDYRFEFENLVCAIPSLTSAWDQLMNVAPTTFQQIFDECHPFWYTALTNNLGIAFGNANLIVPLLLTLLLPIFFKVLEATNNLPLKPEYDDEILQEASLSFSLMILRIRDGKLRGIKKGGTLHNMVKGISICISFL